MTDESFGVKVGGIMAIETAAVKGEELRARFAVADEEQVRPHSCCRYRHWDG